MTATWDPRPAATVADNAALIAKIRASVAECVAAGHLARSTRTGSGVLPRRRPGITVR